jgi:hypothetical protein
MHPKVKKSKSKNRRQHCSKHKLCGDSCDRIARD